MERRLDGTIGWLLLTLAVVLHRTMAGAAARERLQQRRNTALRAARRRGVAVPEIATRLGLSEGWVRQVLNGKRPPPVEEVA
ncbi:hypothetical protein DN051_02805 [Streptomyces cadmiisoli]|uniref:Uncharacterized protein n=1 Tax=Streptomyces cadmiisoli TaxID=2184053 RepID=A0A2Z4ISY0_9ACTN|nr:hypothetical protein DN051_02805 [Streptomyces cadmiisoli]